ncbi:MAG TPA: hypothetical protein VLC98_00890 [Phnomibacter sp.]|nr:hypothetical protein [Phnomibacter sp.]
MTKKDKKIKIEPYHKQPADDAFLYRYVTIDKLLNFLFSGKVPLVRLTEFEDKLEGVDVQHLLCNLAGNEIGKQLKSPAIGEFINHVTTNILPTKRNNYRRQRQVFQKTNFATCWYESNHESVAMWQLYSKPDSVAIRIPYKTLSTELLNYNFTLSHNDIAQLQFGSVDYHRFNDLEDLSNIIIKENTQGFIKDSSFAHEHEFRIMIEIKQKEEKKANESWVMLDEQVEKLNELNSVKVIDFNLSKFKELPFEFIFHPRSYDWHRKNIEKIIDKFGLKFITTESALREIFQ